MFSNMRRNHIGTTRKPSLQPKTKLRLFNEQKSLPSSSEVVCAFTFSFLPRQANKVSLACVESHCVHTDSSYQSLSATCRLTGSRARAPAVIWAMSGKKVLPVRQPGSVSGLHLT